MPMLVLQVLVQVPVLDLTRVRDFNGAGGRLKGRLVRPVRIVGDGKCMCIWRTKTEA
jgi:hypothetical protein